MPKGTGLKSDKHNKSQAHVNCWDMPERRLTNDEIRAEKIINRLGKLIKESYKLMCYAQDARERRLLYAQRHLAWDIFERKAQAVNLAFWVREAEFRLNEFKLKCQAETQTSEVDDA